jgi:hypothetical protein
MKWVEREWHGKCTVFNPVESFRRHIYGTYLVFTATNVILSEGTDMNHAKTILFALMVLAMGACSPKIHGTVQLLDPNLQVIPPAKESPQGTVVNMINTTTTLEKASGAVVTGPEGKFESAKDYIIPGLYKVEANRIGFMTETQTVKIKKFGSKKVEFKLKKIPEGNRKTIEGSRSDEDKIVNPGEVNIQPPTM